MRIAPGNRSIARNSICFMIEYTTPAFYSAYLVDNHTVDRRIKSKISLEFTAGNGTDFNYS